jgi:hypothetical protein
VWSALSKAIKSCPACNTIVPLLRGHNNYYKSNPKTYRYKNVVEISAEKIWCVQCRAQSKQSAKLFLQSSERNWDSLNPSPAGECIPPPPPGSGGRGTLWRERGWKSPNSDEGTYTVVLFIYTYFVVQWQQPIPLLLI